MPSTRTGSAHPRGAHDPDARTRRSRETFRNTVLDRAGPLPKPGTRPPARRSTSTTTSADRNRTNAVPLASLSGPQRRIVTALLEAAKAADAKKANYGSR